MSIDLSSTENTSVLVDKIVYDIVNKYSNDLDECMKCMRGVLNDTKNPITISELEVYVMQLPVDLYFISELSERVGIREDISKMLYREAFNNARNDYKGTVADKNSFAEINASQEQIINICYSRAYKILKNKADMGLELLSSCKKVLSRRIAEIELTRIGGGK